jgi:hypothetical protein
LEGVRAKLAEMVALLERGVEREVLPACERFGLGLLPFFPLASGFLTGKYQRGEPPRQGTRLAAWGARGAAALSDRNFDRLEALEAWAEQRGHVTLKKRISTDPAASAPCPPTTRQLTPKSQIFHSRFAYGPALAVSWSRHALGMMFSGLRSRWTKRACVCR